jgi:hypothetical protein
MEHVRLSTQIEVSYKFNHPSNVDNLDFKYLASGEARGVFAGLI